MIPRGAPLPQCNKEMSLGKGNERVPLWRRTLLNTHLLLLHKSLSAGQGIFCELEKCSRGEGEFCTPTAGLRTIQTLAQPQGSVNQGGPKPKKEALCPSTHKVLLPLLSKSLPTSREDFPVASFRHSYHNSTRSPDGLLAFQKYCETTVKLPTGIGTEYPKSLSRQRNQKSLLRVYTEHSGCLFTWGKFRHWAHPKSMCHCISTEFYESSAGLLKASRQMRSYLKMRSLEISKLTSKSSS